MQMSGVSGQHESLKNPCLQPVSPGAVPNKVAGECALTLQPSAGAKFRAVPSAFPQLSESY